MRLILLIALSAGCGGVAVESSPPTPPALSLRVTTTTPELIHPPIHFTLLGHAFNRTGELNLVPATSMFVEMHDIPPGQGYALSLNTADGDASCDGGAFFGVIEGQTTSLEIALGCRQPRRSGGGGGFVGDVNECPDIRAVVTDPPRGCRVALHVDAVDDGKPGPLAVRWSNGLTGADPVLDCPGPGVVGLKVTVSDGDPEPSCAASVDVSVMCSDDCQAPHASDGG